MPQETPLRPPDGYQAEWYEHGHIIKKWFPSLEQLQTFTEALDNLPIQFNILKKEGAELHGPKLETR